MEQRLKDRLDLQGKLESIRAPYEAMWQEVGDRLMPDSSLFNRTSTPGSKRTQFMFDATAPLALQKYGSALQSYLTPQDKRWHTITCDNAELNKRQEVQDYHDKVADVLFMMRYSARANFSNQAQECYLSNGAWGTGTMFTDDVIGGGFRYRACHLADLYIARNFAGLVDIVHRKFKYSHRQANQAFKDNLPPGILKMLEKDPLSEATYLHCVYPNTDYDARAKGGTNSLKFLSMYICKDEPFICREGNGYRNFPYAFSQNLTLPGETYSRGPASLVLPDIKQINEFEKVFLRQGQLAVDPPILLMEDGALTGFNMQPGALVWGGVNADGEALAKPFLTGARLDISQDMMETKRKVINDAFLVTLFQILVDNPQMTATEAMLRAQEKGQLLGPMLGRNQSEFCGAIIGREIEIGDLQGQLPPKPPILIEAGADYKIEYQSPLIKAQMADEGVAIANTLQFAEIIGKYDQTIFSTFKGGDILRRVAQINGMEADLLFSKEDQAAQDQAKQLSATVQNTLAAAQPASEAAKNFAQAQSIAAASPSGQAPAILPS